MICTCVALYQIPVVRKNMISRILTILFLAGSKHEHTVSRTHHKVIISWRVLPFLPGSLVFAPSQIHIAVELTLDTSIMSIYVNCIYYTSTSGKDYC